MPAAKRRKRVITTTPEELANALKEFGFVTRKEVKTLVLAEVYKITKKHYRTVSLHLKRLNDILTKRFLGKSRYLIKPDPYALERDIN